MGTKVRSFRYKNFAFPIVLRLVCGGQCRNVAKTPGSYAAAPSPVSGRMTLHSDDIPPLRSRVGLRRMDSSPLELWIRPRGCEDSPQARRVRRYRVPKLRLSGPQRSRASSCPSRGFALTVIAWANSREQKGNIVLNS